MLAWDNKNNPRLQVSAESEAVDKGAKVNSRLIFKHTKEHLQSSLSMDFYPVFFY